MLTTTYLLAGKAGVPAVGLEVLDQTNGFSWLGGEQTLAVTYLLTYLLTH